MGGRPCKIPSKLAIGDARELGAGLNTTVPARGLHGCLPIAWPPYRPSKVDVVCLARTTCAGERRLLRRIQNSVASRRTRIATWNAAREIARELTLPSGTVPTAMGTATRPKPRVPVRVLAGRVTTLQSCEFCELRAGRCPTCPKPALVRTISLPRAEYARRRRAIDDRVAWWRCCSRSTSGARRFRGHIVQPAQRRAPRPELPRRLRRGSGASAPGCAAIRLYPRSVLHARAPRASGTEGCRSNARLRSMVPQIEF